MTGADSIRNVTVRFHERRRVELALFRLAWKVKPFTRRKSWAWRLANWSRRDCRTYWGSHGCLLERDHEGEHICSCTFNEDGTLKPHTDEDGNGNVGRAPYYGPDTNFYGDDA